MKTQKFNYLAYLVFLFATTATFLTAQDSYLSEDDLFNESVNEHAGVYDPLESLNRHIFNFNDIIYENALEPLVNVYSAVTPKLVKECASNFFTNLNYPVRLAGNLLQAKFSGAWIETGRFSINITIGLGGIMTPADHFKGFEPIVSEDLGQAFGAWGIGEGPYIVMPLLGPSNLRDLFGRIGDRTVNPLTRPISSIDDWNWEWQSAYSASKFTVTSPSILKRYNQMKGSSIDPYVALRNGYTQYRRAGADD